RRARRGGGAAIVDSSRGVANHHLRAGTGREGHRMRLGFNMASARAPGKAILCGEYAVLHGAPAVATAIDRFALATFKDGVGSPFIAYARSKVEEVSGKRFPPISVDSAGLYDQDKKLGLGSSAAVTAATVGLL